MKKNLYIQPTIEVMAVNTACGICQAVSKNALLINGGGTDTIDPEQGL